MDLSRRRALKLAVVSLLPVGMPRQDTTSADSVAAPLFRPGLAGRPRDRVTDYENDPFIVAVEGQLRCTCGCNLDVYTCRTTDFTCGVSPAMHREVIGLVEENRTAEEILEVFVAKYGETVLMAPKKEGFNIAAYVVPGMAITFVGGAIAWVLARRSRRLAAAPAQVSVNHVSDIDQALLDSELSKLGL